MRFFYALPFLLFLGTFVGYSNSANKMDDKAAIYLVDSLRMGTFLLENVVPGATGFVHLGAMIKSAVDMGTPPGPDLHQELQDIKDMLSKMQEKIDKKVEEVLLSLSDLHDKVEGAVRTLKAFIAEHRFSEDILETASTLSMFMRDTLQHPGHQSAEKFKARCLATPPLDYAYKVVSLLEKEATNPLMLAMEADELRTSETFNKWRAVIENVLAQFLLIESYLNGLAWNSNMYGPNRVMEKLAEVNKKLDRWSDQYKENYWPVVVRRLVEKTVDHNQHVGNDPKALILKEALMKIHTDDVFYIIVYNDVSDHDHDFDFNADQVVWVKKRGRCNTLIYRSRQWKNVKAGSPEFERIKRQVEGCRDGIVDSTWNDGYRGQTRFLKPRIDNAGMVGMIQQWANPAIRSANSFHNRPMGPGWWIKAKCRKAAGNDPIIIAGYK